MTHHCGNKEDLPLLTKLRLQPVEAQALHPGLCSHTVLLSPDRSTFDRFEPSPLLLRSYMLLLNPSMPLSHLLCIRESLPFPTKLYRAKDSRCGSEGRRAVGDAERLDFHRIRSGLGALSLRVRGNCCDLSGPSLVRRREVIEWICRECRPPWKTPLPPA